MWGLIAVLVLYRRNYSKNRIIVLLAGVRTEWLFWNNPENIDNVKNSTSRSLDYLFSKSKHDNNVNYDKNVLIMF